MKKALIILLILVLLAGLLFGLYYFFWTAENFASLGDRAMKNGDYSRAAKRYTTAVELAPENDDYALALAKACLGDGNYTKAERTLVKAIRRAPSADLYTELSKTYIAQDKLYDAQVMLDNISDPTVRSQIDALRPAAPILTPDGGNFSEYISVSMEYSGGTVYYSLDEEYPSSKSEAYSAPVTLAAGETHVSAIVVGENGLVSPLAEGDYLLVGVIEEITFTDAALDALVRELIYKPANTPIMSNDLWTITSLTVPETVEDYSDLRHFIHLQELTIHNSSADNYEFLLSMPELTSLSLAGSLVSAETLEYIGALSNLTTLDLRECGLSNILPLADATAITTLDLSDNSISNIGVLSNFTELTSANLSRNALTSLDALSKLSKLTKLDVSENSITSVDDLANCTTMLELNLANNKITSIAPLAKLRYLEVLNVSNNALTDASGLSNCLNLNQLDLSHNQLSNVDAAQNLVKLTRLNISHNVIEALPDLSVMSSLQQFYGSYNEFEDISSLAGLANLNYVDVDYTDVEDIECLATCPLLVQVNAFGTQVTEAKALEELEINVFYDPSGVTADD